MPDQPRRNKAYVLLREARPVFAIRPPDCCFGKSDMIMFFVTTTRGHFFKAETDRVGWTIYL